MPISAGQRIKAARLNWDSDFTELTSTTPSAAATMTNWGTETIIFANPGVAVKVLATVSGRAFDLTAATVFARYQVMISFDGGSTFTSTTYLDIAIGDSTGDQHRSAIAGQHFREGTPTGDIVVKAQCYSSGANDITFAPGFLSAQMIPE